MYDRSAKNSVRPNPNGLAISTEGRTVWPFLPKVQPNRSAEPQPFLVKLLVKIWSNIDQNMYCWKLTHTSLYLIPKWNWIEIQISIISRQIGIKLYWNFLFLRQNDVFRLGGSAEPFGSVVHYSHQRIISSKQFFSNFPSC